MSSKKTKKFTKKIQVTEKDTITQYFTKTKKNIADSVEEEEKGEEERGNSLAANFYLNSLEEQQKPTCDKQKCVDLKSELQTQLKDIEKKHQQHRDAVNMCTEIIAEKDDEIRRLEKLISEITVCDSSQPSTSSENAKDTQENVQTTHEPASANESVLFDQFKDDFTLEQLNGLREIGSTIRDDSSFVATALKSLYADRLSCLKNKSLTGRGKRGEEKTGISPAKVTVMEKMFNERIYALTKDVQERKNRKKRLNKLIKDALNNISKSIKSDEKEEEVSRRLTFNKE